MLGPLVALLRAGPLALALPLPGLAARLALALLLAMCAAPAALHGPPLDARGLALELARGLALGFAVALPLWAVRAAGGLIDVSFARRRALVDPATVLAWVVFGAAGGVSRLVAIALGSYARWPLGGASSVELLLPSVLRAGADWLSFVAELALPALLALALVEGAAGLVARVEHGARFPIDALALARAARPLVALVMFVASLAILVHGVAAAR